MVRICPACRQTSVIGHRWRSRLAQSAGHTSIRIQRGICKPCDRTLTMLPAWLVPGGYYSLNARQQVGQLAGEPHRPVEECGLAGK